MGEGELVISDLIHKKPKGIIRVNVVKHLENGNMNQKTRVLGIFSCYYFVASYKQLEFFS
jgi:hypothetical protein